MKISAYIPCYNVARYIGPVIEAMLAQTRPPDEFLIIDDGCTDGTLDIAAQYPVRIIRHDQNRGLAAARNTAFANAKYELVAAMDSDAEAEKNWMESLLDAFKDPRVAGSGGRLIEKYREGPANTWRAAYLGQDLGETRLEFEWPSRKGLGGFGTLFRKDAVLAAGGYNEKYWTNFEDVDMCMRLLQAGHRMVFEPHAVAYHLRQDTLRTLLRTSWRWDFHIHYLNGGYNNLPLKLLHNFRWARAIMWYDWHAGRKSLLAVDALMALYHSYADLKYRFSSERLPPVEAEGPNAELYFPRPIRALRRYRNSQQRA
jgi:glycosyltransferase involved in cell wall biosynthesis